MVGVVIMSSVGQTVPAMMGCFVGQPTVSSSWLSLPRELIQLSSSPQASTTAVRRSLQKPKISKVHRGQLRSRLTETETEVLYKKCRKVHCIS